MPSLDEIRASIETRIAQAQAEIDSLQSARDALRADGDGPVERTRGRSTRRTRPPGPPASRKTTTPGPRQTEASDPQTAPPASEPSTEPPPRPRTATGPKPRPRAPRPRANRAKATEILLAGRLETMLRDAENGLSAGAIAKAANARDRQVRELLSERERAGRVRRTGAGRGTRWRLITDEERIAARAAELEQLRTAKS